MSRYDNRNSGNPRKSPRPVSVQIERRQNPEQATRHALAKTAARILSASKEYITKTELASRLALPVESVNAYVDSLCDGGLLSRDSSSGEHSYRRSKDGSRFLEAFVALHRYAGEQMNPQKNSTPGYSPCSSCLPHSSYPGRNPVTLHKNGKCMVCHN